MTAGEAKENSITKEMVRHAFNYDPGTGVLTWKNPTGRRVKVGDVAGALHKDGRLIVGFNGHLHYAHRLIWLYVYGEWPQGVIDHRDGNHADNSKDNLRDGTRKQNQQNLRRARKDSKTGLLGASLCKRSGKYASRIHIGGVYKFLGRFNTPEEAHQAYVEAKRIHHEFCTI